MTKSFIALAQVVAAQVAAQLLFAGLGSSPAEASITVTFLTVIAPLYSAKVARLYKKAFSAFTPSRVSGR